MPKPVTRLHDMEIDEVSVVDKGAAPDAIIAIAKRATQEDDMPKYFTEDGAPVEEFTEGGIYFNEAGDAFEYVLADEDELEEVEAPEPVEVGKSAFGSFSDEIREELSKAFSGRTDDGSRELIAKAAARIDELSKRAEVAEMIAKSERETRMLGEYTEVAKAYNIPGNPAELGAVLYRMAESMSFEDCSVINKALTTAGATIFQEIGAIGGGDNEDIISMVSKAAHEQGSSVIEVLDANPDAYAEYARSIS